MFVNVYLINYCWFLHDCGHCFLVRTKFFFKCLVLTKQIFTLVKGRLTFAWNSRANLLEAIVKYLLFFFLIFIVLLCGFQIFNAHFCFTLILLGSTWTVMKLIKYWIKTPCLLWLNLNLAPWLAAALKL